MWRKSGVRSLWVLDLEVDDDLAKDFERLYLGPDLERILHISGGSAKISPIQCPL